MVLRPLAFEQAPAASSGAIARGGAPRIAGPGAWAIRRLAVRAHHSAAGGDVLIEERLHHPDLVEPVRQAHAETLPVGTRPGRLEGQGDPLHAGELFGIAQRELTAALDGGGQAFELLAAHRSLDVGEPVVVADRWIALEDHLARGVPRRVRHAHAVLPQEAELRIPVVARGGEHPAVARREQLARMEGEAGDVAMGPADALPFAVPEDLAAHRAGCVLDHGQLSALADLDDGLQLTGHADLMHAEDGTRPRRDRVLDAGRVDVEGPGPDVDEHGKRAAVADHVGGGDVRMADGDDLIAGPHAHRQKRHVQRGGAVGDGAGVTRAHEGGELALEGRDLGPLRDPAREDGAARRLHFVPVHHRLGNRDHRQGLGQGVTRPCGHIDRASEPGARARLRG